MSETSEIEAEIARTRAELQATIDELTDRLDPKANASRVVDEAKAAAADLRRRVTGEERVAGEPEATRTGWLLLGFGAAAAALVVAAVARRL
ncbi:MAG TPA: DUF3618 domain-containing protein [Actinotalea sp.]|nr:DUF3618 domain-containing protein [Actinotalea sp.]